MQKKQGLNVGECERHSQLFFDSLEKQKVDNSRNLGHFRFYSYHYARVNSTQTQSDSILLIEISPCLVDLI